MARLNVETCTLRLDSSTIVFGPDPANQCILADDLTGTFNERDQDVERAAAKTKRPVPLEKKPLLREHAIRPEGDCVLGRPSDGTTHSRPSLTRICRPEAKSATPICPWHARSYARWHAIPVPGLADRQRRRPGSKSMAIR